MTYKPWDLFSLFILCLFFDLSDTCLVKLFGMIRILIENLFIEFDFQDTKIRHAFCVQFDSDYIALIQLALLRIEERFKDYYIKIVRGIFLLI